MFILAYKRYIMTEPKNTGMWIFVHIAVTDLSLCCALNETLWVSLDLNTYVDTFH